MIMISCSFAIKVLRSFRVTALCNFIYCLDSACMRNSTPPIVFQENSDTLYTQRRDIGHSHEDI